MVQSFVNNTQRWLNGKTKICIQKDALSQRVATSNKPKENN